MSNKSKSIKVGILSIISIFLIYFGMNFLKGVNILSDGITLHIIMMMSLVTEEIR